MTQQSQTTPESATSSGPTITTSDHQDTREEVPIMPHASASLSLPHIISSSTPIRTRNQRAKQTASLARGPGTTSTPPNNKVLPAVSRPESSQAASSSPSRQRKTRVSETAGGLGEVEGESGADSGIAPGTRRSASKPRAGRTGKTIASSSSAVALAALGDVVGAVAGVPPVDPVDPTQLISTPPNPPLTPGMIDLSRLRASQPIAGPSKPNVQRTEKRPKQARTKSEPMVSAVSAEGQIGGMQPAGESRMPKEEGGQEQEGVGRRGVRKSGARGRKTQTTGEDEDGVIEGMKGLKISGGRGKGKGRAREATPPVEIPSTIDTDERAQEDDEDDEDEVDEILIGSFGIGRGLHMGGRIRQNDEEWDEPAQAMSTAMKERLSARTPRRNSRTKEAAIPLPAIAATQDEATTGEFSAGETVIPSHPGTDRRPTATNAATGMNGRGFQTDGDVTAARYGGQSQGKSIMASNLLAESYLSQSVPSGLMGGYLNRYGDSGEESSGAASGGGRHSTRTAKQRDREVYVKTVEDLDALEDAEQWEMPGLEERGSGQDLTWQQSLFSSPGAVLPRVGSSGGGLGGAGKTRKIKGDKGTAEPRTPSDFEGQQVNDSDPKPSAHKGYSSHGNGKSITARTRSNKGEPKDALYPLSAIPPYRKLSAYTTPKKSLPRQATHSNASSSRPGFSHDTVSAPAIPASGKRNKQVEAFIGMYAGPTFHNSPSPDALPAPRLKGH